MFDELNIGVSRHAIARFRERIDPTAKASNIIQYLKQSELPRATLDTMRQYGYTLPQYMMMRETVYFKYLHVTFVVRRKRGKGKNQVCIVTCF